MVSFASTLFIIIRSKDGYQQCLALVNGTSTKWETSRLMIFDAPLARDLPYESRLQLLRNIQKHPLLQIVEPVLCEGQSSLETFARSTSEGEGVILRKRGSMYLEPKSFYVDKVCNLFITNVFSDIYQGILSQRSNHCR
jgi:hypothetical protein